MELKNVESSQPHEELLHACQKKVGPSAWAIGLGMDEKTNELVWTVYVSNKKYLKKIPKNFQGKKVEAVHCEKPKFAKE